MLRAVMCAAGPEQMMADASFAVDQGAAVEPVARHRALLCAEAHLLAGDSTGPRRCSRRRPRGGRACPTPTRRPRRVRARGVGHGSRAMGGGGRASGAGTRRHRRASNARLRPRVLAFAGAARLAVHRGDLDEANRQLARAMRARPAFTFALPARRAGAAATRQGVLSRSADHDGRPSPAARDRRHPAPPARARRPRRRGRGAPARSSLRARSRGRPAVHR